MQQAEIDGKKYSDFTIKTKEIFNYIDPVTGEESKNQGIQIFTTDGTRIFSRLSGTGTVGATMRFYIEKYENDKSKFEVDVMEYLKDTFKLVEDIFEIKENFGDIKPSAIN